ncbi:hypothetical protein GGR28_003760 [Lewinella aquimaris]|uniref:N-acetyltransferase domain-containing protein n=1 Tax=Neolewinella aquimaris TaxID=1835722 RepID=A0A840EAZ6_9BACT|nr:hypothetical protein [Neolewinella aquimaris]MBB4081113.1 hypothetical protein [Neolewinella aquimaris]
MKLNLLEVANGELIEAIISKASQTDLPKKKDGWQFTWQKLGKIEGADFYKLVTIDNPDMVQGVLMLTLVNEEMLYMNNIEVAPHNYGRQGRYDRVAGGLIAFACYKSFELGKNHYLGYLSFTSKTQLIELYENKYGATFAMGQNMFFDPEAGKQLMKKYLTININRHEEE